MAFIDLTGQRFGRVTVVERDYTRKVRGSTFWRCTCDCGNTFSTVSPSLRRGLCQSCGCLRDEKSKSRFTKHGMKNTKAYTAWQNMKARCYRKDNRDFANYGGRGIKVCDRWLESFENFFEDMGQPQPNESIERIDVDGDYCPSNCQWIDMKMQGGNKQDTYWLELDGVTKTLIKWAEIKNIKAGTLRARIRRGWSDRDTLTIPPTNTLHCNYIEFNGESKTISEWGRITNISRATIHSRLCSGWSVEMALTIPPSFANPKPI